MAIFGYEWLMVKIDSHDGQDITSLILFLLQFLKHLYHQVLT